uniref:Uncharacterized protein n=1 Tax=Glossina palpalis gambiensis TaxID=67801 RepID=A0A1B0BY77_9MUSC
MSSYKKCFFFDFCINFIFVSYAADFLIILFFELLLEAEIKITTTKQNKKDNNDNDNNNNNKMWMYLNKFHNMVNAVKVNEKCLTFLLTQSTQKAKKTKKKSAKLFIYNIVFNYSGLCCVLQGQGVINLTLDRLPRLVAESTTFCFGMDYSECHDTFAYTAFARRL